MTREEAIEWMQEEKASFERAPDLNGCPMTECWQKAIDVYEMAISAIRKQETVTNRNGLNVQMTNAQKIRAMSDEELVNWIADINPFYCQTCVYAKQCRLEYDVETVNYAEKYDCKDGILKWLQQPAEGDDCA